MAQDRGGSWMAEGSQVLEGLQSRWHEEEKGQDRPQLRPQGELNGLAQGGADKCMGPEHEQGCKGNLHRIA